MGSERFLDPLRSRVGSLTAKPPLPEARQLAGLDPERILAAVAEFYDLDPAMVSRRHDPHLARPVAAWLCRRHTEAPSRRLAERLGVSRADSVRNLPRRLEARLKAAPGVAQDLETILRQVRGGTTGPPLPQSTVSADDHESSDVRKPRRKTKNKG
jgi:hypothetical protein